MQILDDEKVAFSLNSIWSDGAYQIVLSPDELTHHRLCPFILTNPSRSCDILLFTQFLSTLKTAGFSDAEVHQLVVENPRRVFVVGCAPGTNAFSLSMGGLPVSARKKIAAIVTAYYPRSHADVIVTKFLKGFPADDGLRAPQVDIASMYMDQVHERDVGVELAKEHGVPIYNSIPKALTLGGKELAVDGVLIIGEHGDYA